MKKFIKWIPAVLIITALINLIMAWLNSRDIQKDADDYASRRIDAEKAFASVGMTLESFERPIKESEIPTRLDLKEVI